MAVASVSAVTGSIGVPDAAPVRDLNTHHCMVPPSSLAEWEARRVELRRRILVSAGLWPMPEKTPLAPRVTGRIEGDGFIVENVAIETLPGFWLCGNLYLPKGKRGPFPAIANPHGHWSNGRLEIQADVEKAPPPPGKMGEGRANLPAIGVDLAREGFIVFAYDMVGYNDTNQVSHGFAGSLDHWYGGVSLMGLQLWNSIRAVDYLCSRKDVDRKRIGVTGASGGGTQTFLLAAVDDRIAASVPVNMVSAYMQGGCLCENGPGLRIGTDNVEIAALAAPKPQLVIAATGDWTKQNPTEEWPAIRAVYALYGNADRTECKQFNYGHNYNIESREAMVAWFVRWLARDPVRAIRERPFSLDTGAMRVWNDRSPRPSGIGSDRELTEAIQARAIAARARAFANARSFSLLMRPALRVALGMAGEPEPGAKRPRSGRAVLIVRPAGERADEAADLVQRLSTRVTDVQTIEVPSAEIEPKEWWDKYRSCYNAAPLGIAAQSAAERIRSMQSRARRVDVVGLAGAGLSALFGRAAITGTGSVIADMNGLDSTDAAAMIRHAYAPCVWGLGGVPTAVRVIGEAEVRLFGLAPNAVARARAANERAAITDERWGADLIVQALLGKPRR